MKPVAGVTDTLIGDPLDLLIDISRAPVEGDDRLATWFETRIHAEQADAAEAKDLVAFERAKKRSVAAAFYRARICVALKLTDTGQARSAA